MVLQEVSGGSNRGAPPSHSGLGKVPRGRKRQAQYLSLKRGELHTRS